MVDTFDEELHEPDDVPHWQESYYFNWADTDGRSYGLTRIGFYESGTKGDGLVLTIRDGIPESLYGAIGVDISPPAHTFMKGGVRVSQLAYEMVEPLAEWRITLDGSPSINMTWRAFMPAFDFAADGNFGELAHHHFEHFGLVNGSITVDGVEHEISGVGHRDKSWGPRDWSGASGWEWISAHFGTDLAFNVSIVFDGERPIEKGFIFHDGRTVEITEATVDYDWDGIEHVPGSARIHFTDAEGERFDVTATAIGQAPLVKEELWLQETPSSFSLDYGGRTRSGVGVMEHTWHAGPEAVMARLDQLAPLMALAQKAAAQAAQAADPDAADPDSADPDSANPDAADPDAAAGPPPST
ncbi:MAG: hypothetical protein V9F03_11570 [Microthrixaceae bacterium]